jgi:hypothetical protein
MAVNLELNLNHGPILVTTDYLIKINYIIFMYKIFYYII